MSILPASNLLLKQNMMLNRLDFKQLNNLKEMKKVLVFAFAALFICASAMAQEEKQEKKGGGFMKALKKGVESATGLKVSDETLFVYPVIGEWKMDIESCIGDKATGEVILKIKVTRIAGEQRYRSMRCLLSEAVITGEKAPFQLRGFSANPLYDFEINASTEVTFQPIIGVPETAKSLDVKFYIEFPDVADRCFEARRVPVEWL